MLANHALKWLEQGIAPIPIVFRTKYPSVPWKQWVGRLPPELLVRAWFPSRKRANLGLLLDGGLTVLDFDNLAAYIQWRKENPALAQTYTSATGRGAHVYLRLDKCAQKTRSFWGGGEAPSGELKATGVIVAPPSIHPTGKEYRVLVDRPILGVGGVDELGVVVGPEITYNAPPQTPYIHFGEDAVGRIKQMVPILDWLSRITTPYPRNQREWLALCPFHHDRNPSLGIWPAEASCYCFSPACRANRKTDVINCAAYWWGCSVGEAIRRLIAETYC